MQMHVQVHVLMHVHLCFLIVTVLLAVITSRKAVPCSTDEKRSVGAEPLHKHACVHSANISPEQHGTCCKGARACALQKMRKHRHFVKIAFYTMTGIIFMSFLFLLVSLFLLIIFCLLPPELTCQAPI